MIIALQSSKLATLGNFVSYSDSSKSIATNYAMKQLLVAMDTNYLITQAVEKISIRKYIDERGMRVRRSSVFTMHLSDTTDVG